MPHQERSRETVEAILEATARILIKDGYDRASTNRIAEAAGVSVGSLYQYFPNKEALVAALVDRHIGEMLHVFDETLARVADAPLRVAAPELVRAMIHAHGVEPRLHKVIVEQTPRTGRLAKIGEVERHARERLLPYLELHRDELRVKDLDLAVYILIQLVEGVSHASVRDGIDVSKERLVDELTDVILAYLVGARSA